jgi:hypothetical protein
MRYYLPLVAAAVVVLLAPGLAPGEVKVIWERNAGDAATPQFKFKSVPSPSKTDAASTAKLTIVAGRRDPNGAGVEALNDGVLPAEEDQPDANFFFAQGTDGGRLVMDLGQLTEIKQVCTYSWHAGTRGPQVYKLYVSDGAAKYFSPKPAKSVSPEKAGWKLVASVDTRPKTGEPGGQYAVAISDPAAGTLARSRYLLFDVSRTEDTDPFGNTFFSEIDVSDGKEHAAPAVKKGSVTAATAAGYEIVFDTTDTPELTDWVNAKLRPICVEWYPKLVEMLPSDGYKPPQRFTITFRKDMKGVAATGGTRVMCAARWFQQNLDGEAAGAVVHEMVHVVQQYGRARGGNRNPGWLVEGIPDYIRWFLYEPPALRPRPNPAKAKYTDSYRITGAFLNYVTEKHDKDFVKKLNAAMRQGKYAPELWKTCTGKTVDELWAEYVTTLR